MPSRRKPPPPPSAAKPAKPEGTAADEAAFIESLLEHGQAAKRRPDGTLPPGATHELIEDEHGVRRVVRRRFSAF